MCLGIPYSSPSYQRGLSADTGKVREIEGAGQLYHGHLKQEGLAGWVAPGWAADDASWWGWLTGPIANRRRWRVALPVACKQQVPGSKQATGAQKYMYFKRRVPSNRGSKGRCRAGEFVGLIRRSSRLSQRSGRGRHWAEAGPESLAAVWRFGGSERAEV